MPCLLCPIPTPDDLFVQHPSPYVADPASLPRRVQAAIIRDAIRDCAVRGHKKAAVYPAGRHAEHHGIGVFADTGIGLACFVDDCRSGSIDGIPICTPHTMPRDVDVVLVSSDSAEMTLYAQAVRWGKELGIEVVRAYGCMDSDEIRQSCEAKHRALHMLHESFNGRINLGCGTHPLEGWTNIDGGDGEWWNAPLCEGVVPLDVFDALGALDDGSCQYVHSEHFYEHFTLSDGYRMATEWARVLRPGGVVRIVMPDLEMNTRIYLGMDLPTSPEVLDAHRRRWLGERQQDEVERFLTQAMILNFSMYLDGHRFVYDFETARAQLESAGFTDITRLRFGESTHEALRGIDRHTGGETGGEWLQDAQLILEGVRGG